MGNCLPYLKGKVLKEERLRVENHTKDVFNLNYNEKYRVALIGNANVGKTSICHQFFNNRFLKEYNTTIGVDFNIKMINFNSYIYKLHVWDTAGHENFKSITKSYYKDVDGILLVYDITDEKSFTDLEYWLKEIENYASTGVSVVLVGNKLDLKDRDVSTRRGEDFVDKHPKINGFIEVSSKKPVNECFELLLKYMIQKRSENNKV